MRFNSLFDDNLFMEAKNVLMWGNSNNKDDNWDKLFKPIDFTWGRLRANNKTKFNRKLCKGEG